MSTREPVPHPVPPGRRPPEPTMERAARTPATKAWGLRLLVLVVLAALAVLVVAVVHS